MINTVMSKKFQIKRKKRFIENTLLDNYTGIILVSSNKPKITNQKKEYKINITNLYLYNGNFCLIDKFIEINKIKNFIKKYFNLNNEILTIDNIFSKEIKIIYLVYLDKNTNIKNLTKYATLNLYKSNELKEVFNNDLYQSIYNNHINVHQNNLKIFYDKDNYIKTSLQTLFYYLIGNDSIMIH